MRQKGKFGKRIMRELLKDQIPPSALKIPKAGFLPDVDQWFRTDKSMMTVFSELLDDSKNKLDYLNWDEVGSLWREHQLNKIDAGFRLLGILQFINWNSQLKAIGNQSI